MHVQEKTVWDFLRLDLVEDDESPPSLAPADREFVSSLIEAAEARLDRYLAKPLAEFETIPGDLTLAVSVDVATHYFNRLNPELPDSYWQLILPFRAWGFGAPEESDG